MLVAFRAQPGRGGRGLFPFVLIKQGAAGGSPRPPACRRRSCLPRSSSLRCRRTAALGKVHGAQAELPSVLLLLPSPDKLPGSSWKHQPLP